MTTTKKSKKQPTNWKKPGGGTDYFQDNLKHGRIYERAIIELHDIGCHKHDAEIAAAREKVEKDRQEAAIKKAKEKQEERQRKEEEEKLAGIRTLHLPANGFSSRLQKGAKIMKEGIPYEVISSYYYDSDGFSFGVMNEEWQRVKAKDISDTPEGKQMIADHEKEIARKNAEKRLRKAIDNLSYAISTSGTLYRGEELSLQAIPGETLLDTTNIYGGGIIIRKDEESSQLWLIHNNGADGDNWGLNNIVGTGGAGAYAHTVPIESVREQLDEFLAAKEQIPDSEQLQKGGHYYVWE